MTKFHKDYIVDIKVDWLQIISATSRKDAEKVIKRLFTEELGFSPEDFIIKKVEQLNKKKNYA